MVCSEEVGCETGGRMNLIGAGDICMSVLDYIAVSCAVAGVWSRVQVRDDLRLSIARRTFTLHAHSVSDHIPSQSHLLAATARRAARANRGHIELQSTLRTRQASRMGGAEARGAARGRVQGAQNGRSATSRYVRRPFCVYIVV